MFDVFISYRRDTGFEAARNLYDRLRLAKFSPFLDLAELRGGKFNEKLYDTIKECRNYILILSPGSLDRCVNEDDWLRREIMKALEVKSNIVPFFINGFSWPHTMPSGMEELKIFNGITSIPEFYDATIEKLINMLEGGQTQEVTSDATEELARIENPYFTGDNTKELKRLQTQQELLKNFDMPFFNEIESSYDELYILDVGCNNGDLIMDRLGYSEKVKKIIGIEYDLKTVKMANDKYKDDERFTVYQGNAESDDIKDTLDNILEKQQIKSFNVINISMLLLHLKNPFKALKNLRKYLSSDGIIIIKDIDDGLNIAYPDENGSFARAIKICYRNDTAGCRHSGRQVFTLLKNAGYSNIELKSCGLSTVGMSYEDREAFFDVYFSFIGDDSKIMTERYPEKKIYLDDYKWMQDNYEQLEEKFLDDNFFFTLGIMIFTAKKR